MKKLMIAAFAIAFAAVAQAAAINWTSSWAVDAQGNDLAAGAQAYLLATSTYSVAQAMSDFSAGTFDSTIAITSATTKFDGDYGAYIDVSGVTTELSGTQEFYMVLLNADASSATEFMIVDPVSVAVKPTGSTNVGFGDLSDADTFESLYAWQPMGAAVPEPTSALMLLVGLAGLALKRKVA